MFIPHNKPTLGQEEIKAVSRVISSGWIAQGSETEKLENEMAAYLGGQPGRAVALSSGTAALYLALFALGIKSGDEVIIPTYVCSAVLNAIFMARAKPILADINEDDLNLSVEQTKKKISRKTKAIILSHTFGLPAELDQFLKLKIPIIEDCAQAIGASYRGRPVGSFGAAAVFSFYASKMLTSGYGGLVYAKDKKLADKIRDYRQYDGRRDYQPRFNFQLSDLQAALARVQLSKLPRFLKQRRAIARRYYQVLPNKIVWPAQQFKERQTNFYRFLIKTKDPEKIKGRLLKQGVAVIKPIATYELLHRYLKQQPDNFPTSESIAKTALSLPVYPGLNKQQINYIGGQLTKLLESEL